MFSRLNTKTKIFIIASIIFVLLALPLTVFISQKQQDMRQRAGWEPITSLRMTPQNDNKNIGENFSSDVSLQNPDSKDISAVDLVISYNNDVLELISFQPNQLLLNQVINDTNTPGKIRFVAINKNSSPIKDALLTLGTLTFKGKVAGTGIVSFSNIQIAAANHPDSLPLDQNNNKETRYIITSSKTLDSTSGGKPLSDEDAPASSLPIEIPPTVPAVNPTAAIPTAIPTLIPTPPPSSKRLRNCEESTYSACMVTGNQPEGWAVYPSSTYVLCPAGQTCYYNPAVAPPNF